MDFLELIFKIIFILSQTSFFKKGFLCWGLQINVKLHIAG